jgi:glutathione S-transferase
VTPEAGTSGRLIIGTRRYSSWSMRGWLGVMLAGIPVEELVLPLAGGNSPSVKAASPSGLVPVLEHDGYWIWESLAILEYCAEFAPSLWPADRAARALARSMAAEMHAGFRPLRQAMPMNLGRDGRPLAGGVSAEVASDIARIATLWQQAHGRYGHGGPFLFGSVFGAVDAMFAPVVTRLISYDAVPASARAYVDAVRAHELVARWYALAAAEPASWLLPAMEQLD